MADRPRPVLAAVAGPKGGVGKSFLALNTAVKLAKAGRRTILADLDLGGANLQAMLGLSGKGPNLASFVHQKLPLTELLKPTEVEGLRFLPGSTDVVGLANLVQWQKVKLINQLSRLEAEVVVVDLGAGSTLNILDIYDACQVKLLVTTPEIPSVLNAYGFLKSLIFRLFLRRLKSLKKAACYDLVAEAVHPAARQGAVKIPDVVGLVAERDEEAAEELTAITQRLKPWLVLNMVQDPNEVRAGLALSKLSKKRLSIKVSHLGEIPFDAEARRSIVKMRPLLLDGEDTPAAEALSRLGARLAGLIKEHNAPS